jgi:hypothetical protein
MKSVLHDIVVVIGMPRSGTTWLYENIKVHPDICVSEIKEINRYLLGMSDDKYRRLFKDPSRTFKIDISPLYYLDREALVEIARRHDKVIFLEREPVSWLASMRKQIAKYSNEADEMASTGLFRIPVAKHRDVMFNANAYDQKRYVAEIEATFGEKLHKVRFSDIEESPVALLNSIERFLGIRTYFNATNVVTEKINAGDKTFSKFYVLLMRSQVLDVAIPIALAVLPKRLIHWLRARFVYGR